MKNKNQPVYEITFWDIGPLDFRSQGLGPEPKTEKLSQLNKQRERGEVKTYCYQEDVGQSDVELVTNFKIQVGKLGPSPRTQFEDILYLANESFNRLGLKANGENGKIIEVTYLPITNRFDYRTEFIPVCGKFIFPLPEKELKIALYGLFDEFKLSVSKYENKLAQHLNSEQRELTRVRGLEKTCR